MPYDKERNREIEKFLFGLENIIVSTPRIFVYVTKLLPVP